MRWITRVDWFYLTVIALVTAIALMSVNGGHQRTLRYTACVEHHSPEDCK